MNPLKILFQAALIGLAASAPVGIILVLSWRYRARFMDREGKRRFLRGALTLAAVGFAATALLAVLAQLRGRLAISGVLAVALTVLVGRGLFKRLAQPKAKSSSGTSWDSAGTDSTS